MQFHITGYVHVEMTPVNCFTVEVRTTEAENGKPSFTVGPIPQEEKAPLQSVIETLRRMQQHHEDGGDERGYEKVLGFVQWFQRGCSHFGDLKKRFPDALSSTDNEEEHDALFDLAGDWSSSWPYYAEGNRLISEKLSRYDVFYYNELGLKFNVLCEP